MRRIAHIFGILTRRFLRLAHKENEMLRDMDYLGYEAFSHTIMARLRSLSIVERKSGPEISGFTLDKTLHRKAA